MDILINKKNISIYWELFKVLDVIIEANGYDFPKKYWSLYLEKCEQILEFLIKNEEVKFTKEFDKDIFELVQKIKNNFINYFNKDCL